MTKGKEMKNRHKAEPQEWGVTAWASGKEGRQVTLECRNQREQFYRNLSLFTPFLENEGQQILSPIMLGVIDSNHQSPSLILFGSLQ